MSRSAESWIADILDAIARCIRYRDRFNDSDPEVAEMAFEAAVRYIAVVGEAANQLPQKVTEALPNIPWPAIIEMRNVLIHEYFGIDADMVVRTLNQDLEPLAAVLSQFLRE